jgi:putative hydrolase of the HAD superfamily
MKVNSAPDVLLFDLGGVLTDFAGFEELAKLLPGAPDPATVRRRWIDSEPVHLFERGDISAREFARRFLAEWQVDLPPSVFLGELTSWARGPYPGAIELLQQLPGSSLIAILSNSNELHTSLHRVPFQPYVDRFYFSNEVRLAKPEPAIFDHVLRDLGVAARQVTFFDDTEVNVDAAVRAGMNAYHVDGIAELEQQLRRLNLVDGRISSTVSA